VATPERAPGDGGLETRDILKRVRRIEIRTRRLVEEIFAGQSESVFKGRGMEFAEVRPYLPGDEVRDIDWNVTARTGEPFVKRFTEERELTVVLAVDVSGSLDFGSGDVSKRELVAELAALLAFSALKNSDRVGLVLFSDRLELFVPPRKGRTQVLRIVRELLTHGIEGRGTTWSAGLDFMNRVVRRRSIVFLLSDFLTPIDARLFRVTSRRHDLVALWVEDPREAQLPAVGRILVEDLESGRTRWVNTNDPRIRESYRAARADARGRTQRSLAGARCEAVPLSTATSYLPPLLRFFQGRRRRAR
jgi:uncharacterized protein (DUF58 family)